MSHGRRRLGMNRDWRRGRWTASVDAYGIPVPFVRVYGEGEDYAYASVGFGSPGVDPILYLAVDLEGTRVGRLVCEVAWRWRKRRAN